MPRSFLTLLLLFCAPAWAIMPAVLESHDQHLSLAPHVGYLEDPDGVLQAEQVAGLPDEAFTATRGVHANLGKNHSTWWFRIALDNRNEAPLQGFLEVDYALLDSLQLYSPQMDGTLQRQQAGDLTPFAERPVQVHNFWFPLTLAQGQQQLLLRVESSSTVFVPLYFSTVAAGAAAHEVLNLWRGMFYGALLAMLLYNLFLYMSLREPAYFWYVLFGSVITLFTLAFDGTLYRLLPNQPQLQSVAIYLFIFLHCLLALQFSRHFLRTFERFPRLDRSMRGAMLVIVACLVSGPLLGLFAWSWLASITVSLLSLGLLLLGLYSWSHGQRLSAYYTLAWGTLLAASILSAMASLGLDLFGVYGTSIIKIGVLIEMLALSLGLADRINLLKEEGFRSRQAAERADLENQAKSRFLAKMSHEIRTPLNGVLGTLQLLGQSNLDRGQQLYLETIASSGRSLMKVINDILDYARIESGNLDLESIELDVEELLSTTFSLFRAQAGEHHLGLYMSLEPEVPRYIHGDPTRLSQVLMNLLSNAIKFTAQGHVTLEVGVRTRQDGQRHLLFAVTDTGIGIAQSDLAQLFRSFSQGDSSTTRRYGGSGLGLAISKELVERMGGRIEVQSAPGKGSRFAFDIPLVVAAGAEEIQAWPPQQVALLCSLDSRALDSLARMLSRWGMRVERCQDPTCLEETFGSLTSAPLLVLASPWPGSPKAALEKLLPHLQADQRVLLVCPQNQLPEISNLATGKLVWAEHPLSVSALRDALDRLYQQRPETSPQTVAADTDAPLESPCILVAEDNPVNQLVVKGFLQRRGYRLRIAVNGREVLDEYRRAPASYQLILMDCEMPEMDGYEATRQIRSFESRQRLPAIPIVALTAHILAEHRALGLAAGMDGFLGKPLDCQQLYATLDGFLKP